MNPTYLIAYRVINGRGQIEGRGDLQMEPTVAGQPSVLRPHHIKQLRATLFANAQRDNPALTAGGVIITSVWRYEEREGALRDI